MNKKRGLGSADQETRQRVARLGGRAAQKSGRAHKLTTEERSRGGKHSSGSFDKRPKEEVQEIGRRGGRVSRGGGRPKKIYGHHIMKAHLEIAKIDEPRSFQSFRKTADVSVDT